MAAAERASWRKSFRNFGSCASSSRRTLIATSRFNVGIKGAENGAHASVGDFFQQVKVSQL